VCPHHAPYTYPHQNDVLSHTHHSTPWYSRYHYLTNLTWEVMLPARNIPAVVSPLCLSLPSTCPSTTVKQWHKRYHLPLGFVEQFISLSCSPSPAPCLPPLPSPLSFPGPFSCPFLSPCLFPFPFPSFVLFTLPVLSHCTDGSTHPCWRLCQSHHQDGSLHSLALLNWPSSHHHHPCLLSHCNSGV